MLDRCPGAANMRTPTITIKKCPKCGGDVEVFSTDMKVNCLSCGQIIYNNINSCIEYCQYAEKCLGTETYQKLKKQLEAKEEI